MSAFKRASLIAFTVGCGGSTPGADGSMTTDGPPVELTGTPIVATAPLGTGESVLGTTTDALFNQVNGDPLFRTRSSGSGNVQTPVDQINFGWIQAETKRDLAANLAGWKLTSASLDDSNTTRYMSMRAYQIDYFEDVDLTMQAQTAPASAVYFVTKIYFGHSYEALFSASENTLTAAVAASLPQASGSISATASSLNLMESNVGNGLVPNNGDALFAGSSGDVMANYSASGPSVPIFVEYRLVPGVSEPPGTTIPWASATKATVSIDEVDVFHNGSTLDAFDTSWSIAVTCSINGAIVEQDGPLFAQPNVTAGGTNVDPNDPNSPSDPNTSDPSSTYGRYAGLTFSHSFPVSDGNRLECDLVGQRTDKDPAVPLPPVSVVVPSVDTTSDADGRTGNFDTGNGLDYQIHYSIHYSPN